MITFNYTMKFIGSMTKTTLLTILIAGVFVLGSIATNEAFATGYMKLGDIKGESTDDGHKDWINLLSVSQAISRGGTTGGADKATFGDIVVVKEIDKSTPKLQEAIAKGQHYRENVIIDFTKELQGGKQVTYLQWELKNVIVSNYSFHGSASGDPIPTEQVSLNFEEIKVTYTKLDKKGQPQETVSYSWNVRDGTS